MKTVTWKFGYIMMLSHLLIDNFLISHKPKRR